MAVDLSQLQAPDIIETLAYEDIVAELKAFYIALWPADQQAAAAAMVSLESEPAVKLIEAMAYRELVLRLRYNDEARALLLATATDSNLDHIGTTYYQLPRLVVTEADPDADPPVEEVLESDDDYRYRCSLTPEGYSVAGPTQAFEFHALSASGQVKSAKADSPEPGTTRVYVLSRTGDGVPDAGLLATVEAALSDEDVRPLSELVVVEPAAIVEYAIEYQLTMYPGAASESALDAAETALAKLTEDSHRLGRDIPLSQLDGAAQKPGIKRAVRVSPLAEIICGNGEAPYCTGIVVTIAGTEE
jgi:phage-related baseplate assembly protein